ncbi:MarR family transcriptional regulator [Romboutsia ilealis]|uniref:MarR family transcriptional regulator n=1 Tax=Romboutsia faecis TaxID=2764597 RepID=A0ABR7JMH0_9FIRM|nr:MarR family transcriptional regulator [Romboutsia faecis]MBC5996136.1 MarR family transcriptional regulator [Romboutsia faecis]MRN23336.1 MarR family transcriptional regulator [Romboutsia ilealis]
MHEKNLAQLLMYDIELFNNLIKNINRERAIINKILTERQFFVLLKIYNCKKMELKNLSKELNVSTSSLCILLNKLVDQNYVYREEDSRDRRNTFYGITEIGEEIINNEMKQISSILESKFMMLSTDERKIMIESLQNIKRIAKKFVTIDK